MRFDLRFHSRTASGQPCQADVSVYAGSQSELKKQAEKAAETAAWLSTAAPHELIPEGAQITVEHVERL